MNPLELFREYWGDAGTLASLGEGHINQTWKVEAADGVWVLQQINRHVFRDPGRVMGNLQQVLAHVRSVPLPELRTTRTGANHVVVNDEWFRVWRFVEGGVVKKQPASLGEAEVAASAFGGFIAALRDLPGTLLPTIQGFHSLDYFYRRYKTLHISSQYDEFITRCLDRSILFRMGMGPIHGDCKFQNVLLSEDGSKVLAILDLDTLMQGHWGFDWGDLVRSAFVAQGAPEKDMYLALLRGFAPHIKLSNEEVFIYAPAYVACTLGVRYLIDHHEGDPWFRVETHGDNLIRAERQFRFAAACEASASEIRRWVESEMKR